MSLLIDIGKIGRLAGADSGAGIPALLTYSVRNGAGTIFTVYRNVLNGAGVGFLTSGKVLNSAGTVINVT